MVRLARARYGETRRPALDAMAPILYFKDGSSLRSALRRACMEVGTHRASLSDGKPRSKTMRMGPRGPSGQRLLAANHKRHSPGLGLGARRYE